MTNSPGGGRSDRCPARGSTSAHGFSFTAVLLLIVMVISGTQLVPVGVLPGWLLPERASMSALWPQGWGFFRTEPDADATVAFRVGPGDHLTIVNNLQFTQADSWGMARSGIAQLVEFAGVSSQLPASGWLPCARLTPTQCRDASLKRTPVAGVDHTGLPTLCGHVLIAVENPARWTADTQAWMRAWKILRIANAEITCAR